MCRKSPEEKVEIGREGIQRSKNVDTRRIAGQEERRGTATLNPKRVAKSVDFEDEEITSPIR